MPAPLAHFLERYLELPAAGSGEGTTWRLLLGPAAGAELSLPLLRLLLAAVVLLLLAIFWIETRTQPWRRRAMLLGLRLAAVVLLWAMAGRVSLQVDHTQLPLVAVLIDTSASMGLTDRYADTRQSRVVRSLAPTSNSPSRIELVQSLLSHANSRWWQTLLKSHQVRLYAFDQQARTIEIPLTGGEAVDPQTWISAVGQLKATGLLTAPAAAVRDVLEEHRGHALSGLVLFTDGAASAGDEQRLSRAAALARERGVPVYPIGVGSRDPLRDFELFDLLADDVAYLGEPLSLSLRHRSFGLSGQATTLTVTAAGADEPWYEQSMTAGLDREATPLELAFTPDAEGIYDLTIAAAALPGEVDVENNVLRQRIEVRREPLRVLLVEGLPRWEYRALKPVLERDDTVTLETYLQSADLDYAPEDRTALRSFPTTQEQLNRYDVILWGDVDLQSLPPSTAAMLQTFVVERGGGLILVAGSGYNPLDYAGTALELLLPVALSGAAPAVDAGPRPMPFRLTRTTAGRMQSFLRLSDDATQDDSAWQSLPAAMDWFVHTPEVQPGALILATGAIVDDRPAPLVVLQRVGRGQVLYHGVDALWTWRQRVEDRYFGRYWSQAVRAVAARREQRSQNWQLTTDRRIYQPGDAAVLQLRGLASELTLPESLAVDVQAAETGERRRVELTLIAGASRRWQGTLSDLPLGEFRALLAGDATNAPAARVECRFRVESPDRERRLRELAQADLEQAARLTQGAYHSFADADQVLAKLPRRRAVPLTQSTPLPLWNRWEPLCLLVLLFGVEWLLRQQTRRV